MCSVLVMAFITVKKYHDHSTSYKGKYFIGLGLQFQWFCPLSSWNMQEDMVLEKKLTTLHLNPETVKVSLCHTGPSLSM